MPMKRHRRALLTQVTSTLVAGAFALQSTGCVLSSTETVNTDKVYLLGPKTESEPGPATRDVTMKAVDTRGTIAFHLDRARECTVTSTPRYQKVHIEGKQGKNVTGGIITGAILVAVAGGLLAGSFLVDNGEWTREKFQGSSESEFTGAGIMGLTGVIVGISGLVILPRGIYHAAVSGTTVTPGEVEIGTPPPGAVRAPAGYDPKKPQVTALAPRLSQPRYGILDFGAKPAEEIQGIPALAAAAPKRVESLRSARAFDEVTAIGGDVDPALIAIPAGGGGGSASDQMRACVAKYTPTCQKKCGEDRTCTLECLRKPCVENLDQEVAKGDLKQDEYTTVITKTEVCERAADSGIGIAVIVKDADGVPKTIDIGKTDRNGDVKKDMLAGLEGAFPGWPDAKQVVLKDAQVVLVEDPSVVLGELNLEKYPGLKYAEHVQSTKKGREAMALAEAQKRDREAKEKQAMLEAAAKAQYEAEHADEIKAQAAKKQQACIANHSSRCNADCQGNQACVKKCMQKMSCK